MLTDNVKTEHFCTLFDKNYLPQGLSLHKSLVANADSFHLWIVCMDNQVEEYLIALNLPHVSLIPLKEIESPELLLVKPNRSPGEYCWTITPFTFQAVFEREPSVHQVTYLDADIFFFNDPWILLSELTTDEHILITEHAYAPEYDQSSISGKFCVQFLTIKQTSEGQEVMKWWQKRCVEWCFDRVEDDKFGDQKYLDRWPSLFGSRIHIIQKKEKTLAPWNISYFSQVLENDLDPVFYHFHGLKLISLQKIQLYHKYKISVEGKKLYKIYINSLISSLQDLSYADIPIPFIPQKKQAFFFIKQIKWFLFKEIEFSTIPTSLNVSAEKRN